MTENLSPIMLSPEEIQQSILFVRGQRVMLDKHLAILYGVDTRTLLQAVKRNADRFPADFMFQLTSEELQNLRSQTVISKCLGSRILRMKMDLEITNCDLKLSHC